jgi:hypothetical protein
MDNFLEYGFCGFFLQVQKEQGGAGKVAAAAAASEILFLFLVQHWLLLTKMVLLVKYIGVS